MKIICNNTESFQPRGICSFDVSKLVMLCNRRENGMYVKYSDCGGWKMFWPSDGQFT